MVPLLGAVPKKELKDLCKDVLTTTVKQLAEKENSSNAAYEIESSSNGATASENDATSPERAQSDSPKAVSPPGSPPRGKKEVKWKAYK